ncbi:DUF3158 family protein [Salmonella enterica]|nr:DUF3158 family protein [Salmonella enterica]
MTSPKSEPALQPGYRALSDADWFAYESCLKGLLRVREPLLLARHATEAAASLHQIQTLIIHRAWRWRNQQNNRSGTPGWQALVQDTSLPQAVRDALLAIERDRIVFNMRMSVTTFILRQIRECAIKMTEAGNIAASISCNNITGD